MSDRLRELIDWLWTARLGRSDYRSKPWKVAASQRKELVMRRIIGCGQTGKKAPAGKSAESFRPCTPKGFHGFQGEGAKTCAHRHGRAALVTPRGEFPYPCAI
ncbi:hypothetical protein SPURM210S_03498 [Streptomyces purpurascens]|nr:hypothetical protein GCM10010303_18540 [Streptomyces purpurascens]